MFLSYLIALIRREKLIIDLRDIFSEALESNFTQKNSVISRYFLKILYAIESLCLNYASLRVQVSPRFESYYRNSVKKEWLNCMNGIDEEFLDIKPISTRKSGLQEFCSWKYWNCSIFEQSNTRAARNFLILNLLSLVMELIEEP